MMHSSPRSAFASQTSALPKEMDSDLKESYEIGNLGWKRMKMPDPRSDGHSVMCFVEFLMSITCFLFVNLAVRRTVSEKHVTSSLGNARIVESLKRCRPFPFPSSE
ncbi:hypothetical protein BT69DRAFT_1276809 [Atractiella rhizophila]|nr:hypothetical protein BT69DRAFT_1276809 [Atractiella rhizophila]